MRNQKLKAKFSGIALLVIFSTVLVSAAETDLSGAVEKGDFGSASGIALNSIGVLIDQYNVLEILSIFLGIVLISLIALRLATLLNKPKKKPSDQRKPKEEKKFKEMVSEKDKILEELKRELAAEKAQKKRF